VSDLPPAPTARDLHWVAFVALRGHTTDTDLLAPLLLSTARSGDTQLVTVATRLLVDAEPRLWLSLDVSLRHVWARVGDSVLPVDEPLVLALAACHPDGHEREAAVTRLAGLDHPLVLPVLALRAADWVPQVRDRARSAVETRLGSALATLALAPMARALRARRDGRWLADRLEPAG